MSLVPFKLSEHIIHYFFREFEGSTKKYAGREVKTIPISPQSFVGKFIISNLRKIDYPVKNIQEFNMFIEIACIKRKKFCTKQRLFKKENLNNSFVELPEEFIHDVDGMLDDVFRQNFYYFVLGNIQGDDKKVYRAVRKFMDHYGLWEFDFNIEQLRQLFYRMHREGPGSRLQNRDMSFAKLH